MRSMALRSGTRRYAFLGSRAIPLVDGNNGQQVTAANVVIMGCAARPDRLWWRTLSTSYSVRTYIVGKGRRRNHRA